MYPGGSNKAKKETVHRKAYLQLDVLKPGDIFVSISLASCSIWTRYVGSIWINTDRVGVNTDRLLTIHMSKNIGL